MWNVFLFNTRATQSLPPIATSSKWTRKLLTFHFLRVQSIGLKSNISIILRRGTKKLVFITCHAAILLESFYVFYRMAPTSTTARTRTGRRCWWPSCGIVRASSCCWSTPTARWTCRPCSRTSCATACPTRRHGLHWRRQC